MKHISRSTMLLSLLLVSFVIGGCLPVASISHTGATSASGAAVPITDFPGAGALDLTVAQDGTLYVALGIDSSVFVARSQDNGVTFTRPLSVSQGIDVFVYPVERPALVITQAGRLIVAWTDGMNIWRAISEDQGATFGAVLKVSGESFGGEAGLVRMALDAEENPVVTWLYAGMLHLACSTDGGASFAKPLILDSMTCECCYPPLLIVEEQVVIAYRDQDLDAGKNVRDIFVIRSQDGGAAFVPEVRVSDTAWFLHACPLSGPALAHHAGRLYVSWMDGRNDTQHDLSQTDIWLATSLDGGKSFTPNQRINPTTGAHNNRPALAVDPTGRLHLVWEAQEKERDVIYHTRSDDGGATFSDPRVIISSTDGTGRKQPGFASLVAGANGYLYLSWRDNLGGHVAVWQEE